MTTLNDIKEELTTELSNGEELNQIEDRAGEWIDGHFPVYNSEIIKEWQDMPSEYDDRGAEELGHMGETTIIGLMSLDLYLYYSDLFSQAVAELREELEIADGYAVHIGQVASA